VNTSIIPSAEWVYVKVNIIQSNRLLQTCTSIAITSAFPALVNPKDWTLKAPTRTPDDVWEDDVVVEVVDVEVAAAAAEQLNWTSIG